MLFVCLGNICRSPSAEAVFKNVVDKAGLAGEFEIDSCGTGGGSSNWYLPGGFRYARQPGTLCIRAARSLRSSSCCGEFRHGAGVVQVGTVCLRGAGTWQPLSAWWGRASRPAMLTPRPPPPRAAATTRATLLTAA